MGDGNPEEVIGEGCPAVLLLLGTAELHPGNGDDGEDAAL
jgi:hypothetical protein